MSHPPVILVTGAARRVGAEITRTLHSAGAVVVAHYRSSAVEVKRLVAELNEIRPASAACVQGDLCDIEAINHLVRWTVGQFGRLDVLVNNASAFFPTPLGAIDEEVWNELVGSNFKGPLFLAQAAEPYLTAANGSIVNIIDVHAERPLRGYALYCAAKAGLLGLTRALAVELAPHVRVNGVAPGAILWPQEDPGFSPVERSAIIAQTLLKRVGEPLDVAKTVKFLVFDAPYITGQVISVDGGRTVHL